MGAQVLDTGKLRAARQLRHDAEKLDHALGIEIRRLQQLDAESIRLELVFAGKVDQRLAAAGDAPVGDRGAELGIDPAEQ